MKNCILLLFFFFLSGCGSKYKDYVIIDDQITNDIKKMLVK